MIDQESRDVLDSTRCQKDAPLELINCEVPGGEALWRPVVGQQVERRQRLRLVRFGFPSRCDVTSDPSFQLRVVGTELTGVRDDDDVEDVTGAVRGIGKPARAATPRTRIPPLPCDASPVHDLAGNNRVELAVVAQVGNVDLGLLANQHLGDELPRHGP